MNQHATVTALRPRHTPITKKCLQSGVDPEMFFPAEPPASRPDDRDAFEMKARSLCAGCPFAVRCLTNELTRMATSSRTGGDRDTWGILGGTAPWERKNMLRKARRRGLDLDEVAIRFHEQAEAVA